MNLIIVHGEKPLRNGEMHPAFKERLDEAVRVAQTAEYQAICITGGQTRANTTSEAEMGKQYLQGKVSLPIELEDKSRTTIENIVFTRRKFERLDKALVITSKARLPRIQFLYKKFWPELYPKITFVGAKDFYSPFYFLLERVYWLFALLDPRERYITKLTKHLFRNA